MRLMPGGGDADRGSELFAATFTPKDDVGEANAAPTTPPPGRSSADRKAALEKVPGTSAAAGKTAGQKK
jgi:hypothetical protein